MQQKSKVMPAAEKCKAPLVLCSIQHHYSVQRPAVLLRDTCAETHFLSFGVNSYCLGGPARRHKVILPPGSVISVGKC